jgi:hypothetical protein
MRKDLSLGFFYVVYMYEPIAIPESILLRSMLLVLHS